MPARFTVPTAQPIAVTRGDTDSWHVVNHENGEESPFLQGDVLWFTVKLAPGNGAVLIQKKITAFEADGSAKVAFVPSDTKLLSFGKYVYDVQLNRADGSAEGLVKTIIPPSEFAVLPEVTTNA